jgi:aromatic O-demethylase, cytochrome P450 subunit
MTNALQPAWLDDVTPAALDHDPYPWYARMRDELPVAYVPWAQVHFVTRWQDCYRVGNDTEAFRGAEHHRTVNRVFGQPNILTSVDPDHRDLRNAVDPHLRPRQVNGYIDDLARPLVREHLAEIRARGAAELMGSFFEPVSVRALGELLGLDFGPDVLRRWFWGLNTGISNRLGDPVAFAVADEISAEIEQRVGPVLDALEVDPNDSLLSHMLHGGAQDGGTRSRDAIYPTLKVILLGGMQEPGHAAGSTLLGLLGEPEQLERVTADRSLVATAVVEGLRWIAPIGSVEREATREVEVGGVALEAGDVVEVVMASANRDERRFADPDRFNIDRPRQAHMAFGNGDHLCSGHYFSRLLERIALEELLDALPGIELDPDHEPVVRGWNFRAPKELHVRWNA